jgi:hypothetical protein
MLGAAGFLSLTTVLALQAAGLAIIVACLVWLWRGARIGPALGRPTR